MKRGTYPVILCTLFLSIFAIAEWPPSPPPIPVPNGWSYPSKFYPYPNGGSSVSDYPRKTSESKESSEEGVESENGASSEEEPNVVANGRPIYFGLSEQNGSSVSLISNSSGSWKVSLVDLGTYVQQGGLAVDDQGSAHVFYNTAIRSGGGFTYATNSSGKWVRELIKKNNLNSGLGAIALTSAGSPALTWAGEYYGFWGNQKSASGWEKEMLIKKGVITSPYMDFAVAVDNDDKVHRIAKRPSSAQTRGKYSLIYNAPLGTSVVDSCDFLSVGGVATDKRGAAHMVYLCANRSVNRLPSLIHVSIAKGKLVKTRLLPKIESVARPSISIGEQDEIHVTYTSAGSVYYLSRPQDGKWFKPKAVGEDSSDSPVTSQITLDKEGNPHILFMKSGGEMGVFHTTENSGSWTTPARIWENSSSSVFLWGIAVR